MGVGAIRGRELPGEAWGIDWVAMQAVATIITGLILAITLWFVAAQLKHARELTVAQTRPYVVVDIVPGVATIADLVVTNIGPTAAYDVQLTFDPPVATTVHSGKYELAASNLLTEGIPTLAPTREIRTLFDQIPPRLKAELPLRYEVTVTYTGLRASSFEDRFVADLTPLIGLLGVDRKGAHEAAKALEEITKTLKQWTFSNRGVRTFTSDHDRYRWDNGYLIKHPRWLGRVFGAAVRIVSGVNINPSIWNKYEDRPLTYWPKQIGRHAGARWRSPR